MELCLETNNILISSCPCIVLKLERKKTGPEQMGRSEAYWKYQSPFQANKAATSLSSTDEPEAHASPSLILLRKLGGANQGR